MVTKNSEYSEYRLNAHRLREREREMESEKDGSQSINTSA